MHTDFLLHVEAAAGDEPASPSGPTKLENWEGFKTWKIDIKAVRVIYRPPQPACPSVPWPAISGLTLEVGPRRIAGGCSGGGARGEGEGVQGAQRLPCVLAVLRYHVEASAQYRGCLRASPATAQSTGTNWPCLTFAIRAADKSSLRWSFADSRKMPLAPTRPLVRSNSRLTMPSQPPPPRQSPPP